MREINGVKYLTAKEAAKKLGTTPKTLREWVTNNNGKYKIEYMMDPFSGYFYFREEVIKDLIKKFEDNIFNK